MLDVDQVQAALDRAAWKAVHGTREERQGRFMAEQTPQATEYPPEFTDFVRMLVRYRMTTPLGDDVVSDTVVDDWTIPTDIDFAKALLVVAAVVVPILLAEDAR